MKKIVVFIVTAILLSACANDGRPTKEQLAAADYGGVPKNHQKTVMEYINTKRLAFDPQSLQYDRWSNLHTGMYSDQVGIHYGYMGCVYINAKNRQGGYAGYKPIVYVIRNDEVIFMDGGMHVGTIRVQEILEQCNKLY
jgi:hypothetical protein